LVSPSYYLSERDTPGTAPCFNLYQWSQFGARKILVNSNSWPGVSGTGGFIGSGNSKRCLQKSAAGSLPPVIKRVLGRHCNDRRMHLPAV